jgi:hypothetical protein
MEKCIRCGKEHGPIEGFLFIREAGSGMQFMRRTIADDRYYDRDIQGSI